MSELGLCLSKRFLGLLTSDPGRDVAAGAAITDEAAIAVEKGFATDFNGDRRSVWPNDPVDKAAERLVCFMSGDMGAPFLGIFRDVTRKVPPPSSERLGPRDAQSAEAFRECNESVVRASLPKPVRGRVCKVAKALLILPQRLFNAIALGVLYPQCFVARLKLADRTAGHARAGAIRPHLVELPPANRLERPITQR